MANREGRRADLRRQRPARELDPLVRGVHRHDPQRRVGLELERADGHRQAHPRFARLEPGARREHGTRGGAADRRALALQDHERGPWDRRAHLGGDSGGARRHRPLLVEAERHGNHHRRRGRGREQDRPPRVVAAGWGRARRARLVALLPASLEALHLLVGRAAPVEQVVVVLHWASNPALWPEESFSRKRPIPRCRFTRTGSGVSPTSRRDLGPAHALPAVARRSRYASRSARITANTCSASLRSTWKTAISSGSSS